MKEAFEKQQEFQKILGNDTSSQEYKNLMFLGLFGEVGEVMRETKVKAHRPNQVFDKTKFLNECADVQLYLFNLVLSATSFEEFQKIVEQKQKINFMRLQNGS